MSIDIGGFRWGISKSTHRKEGIMEKNNWGKKLVPKCVA
jgi:hypothetical protein